MNRQRETERVGRRRALRKGRYAEILAAFALRLKGYRILARNYRNTLGEIDIVARKRDLVIFVEVKARASESEALDAVTGQSQRRIANAAEIWIGRQHDAERLSWRFDVVAIMPGRWPVHFEDAF